MAITLPTVIIIDNYNSQALPKNLSREWTLSIRSYPPECLMLERGAANSSLWCRLVTAPNWCRTVGSGLNVECLPSALLAVIVFLLHQGVLFQRPNCVILKPAKTLLKVVAGALPKSIVVEVLISKMVSLSIFCFHGHSY